MNIKIFCRCSLFPSCPAKDLSAPPLTTVATRLMNRQAKHMRPQLFDSATCKGKGRLLVLQH